MPTKTIVLMRHGQTHDPEPGQLDKQRALTQQGTQDVEAVSLQLQQSNVKPSLILASSAQRTRMTCEILQQTLACGKIVLSDELYNASAHSIQQIISKVADEHSTIVIIGHNPGMSELTQWLSQGIFLGMSTSNAYMLHGDITHWHELTPSSGGQLFTP